MSIFSKNSPLHDGAVIIRNGRLRAARCILPVTDNTDLPAQYGLRHRAGLGMSEVTDAVVLIISEETGQIALAHEGVLETNLSIAELRARLGKLLFAKPIAADTLTNHPKTLEYGKDNVHDWAKHQVK
jgi:DNA integrity scanning protein DisA with diadenylate cyclase activity